MDRRYLLVGIANNDPYHHILREALPGDEFLIADEDDAQDRLCNNMIDGTIIFVSRLTDPIQIVRQMRQAKEKVPIILISPLPSTSEMIEAIRAGATDYIPKYEQPDTLRRELFKVSFI